jgi:hypothetical protein
MGSSANRIKAIQDDPQRQFCAIISFSELGNANA